MKKKIILFLTVLTLFGCTPVEQQEEIVEPIEEIETEVEEIDWHEYLVNLEFEGAGYKVINDDVPFFTEEDMEIAEFELYSELDELGRCGVAFAMISPYTLPTEVRKSIASIKPSGWQSYNVKTLWGKKLLDNTYWVYNRCHLIGYALAAENSNKYNLITGTRYMNMNMADFEEEVCNYVKKTQGHVLYRVTPIFEGDNLLANGVLIEAKSLETEDVQFCIYFFNVQLLSDGTLLNIDYKTGEVLIETLAEES